jgi:hypothetical protein
MTALAYTLMLIFPVSQSFKNNLFWKYPVDCTFELGEFFTPYFFNMRLLLAISYFVKAAFAASRTTAPSGAITVGSGGTYSTVGVRYFDSRATINNNRFKLL